MKIITRLAEQEIFLNMIDRIRWLGHGSFLIEGPPAIYINPWRVLRNPSPPDVILIGHDHYEHCSPADIDKLRGPHTRVIGSPGVAAAIDGCEVLRPWQSITIDRASIKGIPAYSPHDMRHPVEAGGLGFLISINLYDIYYAGDTGVIPEMSLLHPDIAILPIDDNGTMTIEEAAEIARRLQPRWVFPCNWGLSPGTGASHLDARLFRDSVGDSVEVIIPEQMR